jgi:hypothetical protein
VSRFQIVWAWCGFGFDVPTHGLRLIYRWSLSLGFVQIRRWENR